MSRLCISCCFKVVTMLVGKPNVALPFITPTASSTRGQCGSFGHFAAVCQMKQKNALIADVAAKSTASRW